MIRDYDFDEGCFASILEGDAFQECMSSEGMGTIACNLLQGDRKEGETCSAWFQHVPPFVIHECVDDLTCWNGYCRAPGFIPPLVSEGARCFFDASASCPSEPIVKLYCGEDERCHPQASLGERCDAYDGCIQNDVPGPYCAGFGENGEGTCTVRNTEGEACDPSDWKGCYGSDGIGWCDPETNTCTATGPTVCRYAEHPFRYTLREPV
ncbi:MAG TPA: hypothetical protein VFG69_21040 [Nannocystaceae bacterium]|nr:hypothetical protein [Nannocystaceae bacterium]